MIWYEVILRLKTFRKSILACGNTAVKMDSNLLCPFLVIINIFYCVFSSVPDPDSGPDPEPTSLNEVSTPREDVP
jgi:hypothetical protein